MRYMMMRKADADTERGVLPSNEVLGDMGAYNERMLAANVFISGDGLKPSSEGYRIRFTNGEPEVIRGPFENAGALLAGYSIIEVGSAEEAIDWAKQWPKSDGAACLELRPYYELDDFAPRPEIERHRAMCEARARLPKGVCSYLAFPGTCREAMTFYAQVLGGQLVIHSFGETPIADQLPPGLESQVANAELRLGAHTIMASDMTEACDQPVPGAVVQLYYDDLQVASEVFDQLAEGGSVQMPFASSFWAEGFGTLTDRFGTGWMINCRFVPQDQWQ